MTLTLIVPAFVALIGLLLHFFSTNGKLAEVGRILLFCGVLVTLFVFSDQNVRLP